MADADDFKRALLGQHLINTDTANFIANVTKVMVMPQPYGCVFAHTLTPTGEINPHHVWIRTGVCDVGTYTVDVTLDNDGEYIDSESGSVEGGVYTAHERIAAELEKRYRQKMPYKIVEQVLRTLIRAFLSGEVVTTLQGEMPTEYTRTLQLSQLQAETRWIRTALMDMPDYLEDLFSQVQRSIDSRPVMVAQATPLGMPESTHEVDASKRAAHVARHDW